jgi:hypothetical protein
MSLTGILSVWDDFGNGRVGFQLAHQAIPAKAPDRLSWHWEYVRQVRAPAIMTWIAGDGRIAL